LNVRAQAIAEVEGALDQATGETVGHEAASSTVAWPELVSLVRRTMRSIAGPTADLEDLTQVALERMVHTLGRQPRFMPRAQLSTFAYRVCAGVAKNHWRWWRRWVKRFVLGTEGASEPAVDPRACNALQQRARRLHALLDGMAPERRLVIVLSDLEGLPASRVAEILGCPEGTVRSRLKKARVELAARVLKDPWFSEEVGRRVERPYE
jgi:RNA polymerase sigma-70 factor (ECF subfamily)